MTNNNMEKLKSKNLLYLKKNSTKWNLKIILSKGITMN